MGFDFEHVRIESTEEGRIRVMYAEGGGPVIEYPDAQAVMLERPFWLNPGTQKMLLSESGVRRGEVGRAYGGRPNDMSRAHYRVMDDEMVTIRARDAQLRPVAVHGRMIHSWKDDLGGAALYVLPAFLTSSLGPQFVATRGGSLQGPPYVSQSFDSFGAATAALPPGVREAAQFELSRLQSVQGANLGTGAVGREDDGFQRWTGDRVPIRRDREAGSVAFDGSLASSTKRPDGLTLYRFLLHPTPGNAGATLARVVAEKMLPEDCVLRGIRSAIALDPTAERLLVQTPAKGRSAEDIEDLAVRMAARLDANRARGQQQLILSTAAIHRVNELGDAARGGRGRGPAGAERAAGL